ncbi:MAG: winged helix DNA-binding domain-containing protein [Trueperaceae bacterium]
MRISARALNRATLGRQMLLGRESLDVVDAVRRVVALQAQQPASPYVALWTRLSDFVPAELDAAFADKTIVKATLMRITLHAVRADDHPAMHAAMQPTLRNARLGDSRFTTSGLSAAHSDALIPDLLEFACQTRSTPEVKAWLDSRLGVPAEGVWWALRSFAPLFHAPTGGPWSFGQRPSFVAAECRPALAGANASAESLQTLVLRYLEGFGPASVADVAQFALVQRTRVRKVLPHIKDQLDRLEGPNGEELFDIPGAVRPDEDTPAPPRLMAMWDSTLLAYKDRSRVIPSDYRKLVTRVNGDVLPTLLVDGYVAGVWRAVEGGIEVTPFHRLPDEVWEGLACEARSLVKFLADREPEVYRRYHHWWSKLPRADARLLPGD